MIYMSVEKEPYLDLVCLLVSFKKQEFFNIIEDVIICYKSFQYFIFSKLHRFIRGTSKSLIATG